MTYEAWRISYQSSEQAARAAYAECVRLRARLEAAEKERDDLLAKIEVMKGYPPYVAIGKILTEVMDIAAANGADSRSMPDEYVEVAAWLCGVAGAQPAPSVPEGWKLVPTAESRHPGIYKMLGALHTVDNTPGASEWESYAAFLAAAPEAKPCP